MKQLLLLFFIFLGAASVSLAQAVTPGGNGVGFPNPLTGADQVIGSGTSPTGGPRAIALPNCPNGAGYTTAPTSAFLCINAGNLGALIGGGGTSGGSANAYTVTLPGSLTLAQLQGVEICFMPVAANTSTTPTLQVNSLSPTTITKWGQADLSSANPDLVTTSVACVIYDGTDFELQNAASFSGISNSGTTVSFGTRNISGATVVSLSPNTSTKTGTSGSAVCWQSFTNIPKMAGCNLNGYAETGAAQTYSYPTAFATAVNLIYSSCSDSQTPSSTTSTLTLPAGSGMSAETCVILAIGE